VRLEIAGTDRVGDKPVADAVVVYHHHVSTDARLANVDDGDVQGSVLPRLLVNSPVNETVLKSAEGPGGPSMAAPLKSISLKLPWQCQVSLDTWSLIWN
jgi:hypothetical protein